jgi:hypothetical protein
LQLSARKVSRCTERRLISSAFKLLHGRLPAGTAKFEFQRTALTTAQVSHGRFAHDAKSIFIQAHRFGWSILSRIQITMGNQGATKQSGQGQSSGAFPLDNLTYDLVTVLYEKSKGLEAYDKYIRDAQNNQQAKQLFEQMRQQDELCIQLLAQQLGLRAGQQGSQSRP